MLLNPIHPAEFADLLDPLGPFEPQPLLAVAVSGGADSMATALILRDWARGRAGAVVGLIVDHGLRPESAVEAELTQQRLFACGITAEILPLHDLKRGARLAERARSARHAALEAACAARGILHLVFGHHAEDLAETVVMRLLAHSGPSGLAGMAALVETQNIRRLRPLLAIPRQRLRDTLRAAGVAWVEDPSNQDLTQQRARLRALRSEGLATEVLVAAATARGRTRLAEERQSAHALARGLRLSPFGYAVLDRPVPAAALANVIAMLAGATRPPSLAQVGDLALHPRAATIGGVRLLPAGRLGPGWLLVREQAAIEPPTEAKTGTLWDGRFRLLRQLPAPDCAIGAWGDQAPRDRAGLPSLVLRTLPALRRDGQVIVAGPALWQGSEPFIHFCPQSWMTGGGFCALPPVAIPAAVPGAAQGVIRVG